MSEENELNRRKALGSIGAAFTSIYVSSSPPVIQRARFTEPAEEKKIHNNLQVKTHKDT